MLQKDKVREREASLKILAKDWSASECEEATQGHETNQEEQRKQSQVLT